MLVCVIIAVLCAELCAGQTDSGFIQVSQADNANLFYFYQQSESNPKTDPVILWLQGGPGCSSLFGLYVENGPLIVQPDGSFKPNQWSWTKKANMLWIDSPAGTGYSYVDNEDYPSDEKTIANDLYTAVSTFLYQKHPELSNNSFYIFGESYAGKYVPWLASTILTQNGGSTKSKINLKGIAIGDGWTNPYYQTGSYGPYLYNNSLINSAELDIAYGIYETYKGLVDVGAYESASIVGNGLLSTLMTEAGVGDPYDIRKSSDPTDPLMDLLTTYLNDPSIKKKLNAGDSTWQACADGPYLALLDDVARSAEFIIPQILAKIPVLLYNGDKDLICNYMGTADWAAVLDWPNQQAFNNARNTSWVVPNSGPAGYYKTAATLTKLVLYNAGHMVPYDQPQNAFDMVFRFIGGGFKP